MKYRVRVTHQAEAELLEIAAWIALDSPAEAERWLAGMQAALGRLTRFPERCPRAPESELSPRGVIRQLLVGDYRALFSLQDSTVLVLMVRHASRRSVAPEELERARSEEEWPPRATSDPCRPLLAS